MLGAAAVLGEEQVVGSSSPLLLPSGIFTASLAHSGPVLALYEASLRLICKGRNKYNSTTVKRNDYFISIIKQTLNESVSGLWFQPILQYPRSLLMQTL